MISEASIYSHVLNAAQTLFEPSQVVELRVLYKNGRIDSGYFDDLTLLAKTAEMLDERDDVSGIYWTLNPVKPDCLHRAKNRMREWASQSKGGATTSDREILERRLLLIDFDGANRPAGISATDEELEAAKAKAVSVARFFAERKWGAPIAAMSGNGYHLLYKVNMPNDEESAARVKKFLMSLALLFNDEKIKIDTSVFNASRISKVYGTEARKGDNTPERPHRRSMLLETSSAKRRLITVEQVENIVALMPEELSRTERKNRPPRNISGTIDVPQWVEEHLGHITVREEKNFNGGKLYVLSECPFDPQHKAPDAVIGQMPSGAVFFKCFHNSCQGHDWQTLKERYGGGQENHFALQKDGMDVKSAPASSSTGLPIITLGNGQLRDVTDEVIRAIETAGKTEPLLYVRGDRLARVVMDSDGHPQPGFVGAEAIPEIMSRAADFIRTRNSVSVGVFPPESLAKAIVNRGRWPFPRLKGIVEIPVLRMDGTILERPGYDPASELYYCPNGPIPKIHDTPDREEAMNAARFLLDVLSDFPFQDEASRDNALALLLTVAVKEIVGLAPIALIDAPTRGTGKTRLAQIASIVASGHELPLSPEVRDDEEWRKKITSLLIADRPVIIIDNVERTLCSGQLSAVLTTSEWTDRILGKSEVIHLHSRAVWIATGNNIRLGGDIGRRAYWIRLNANLPRPWLRDARDFKRELPAWAVQHTSQDTTKDLC